MKIFNTKEAAEYLGLSKSFLNKSRVSGHDSHGIPYLQLTKGKKGRVGYLQEDLDNWIRSRRLETNTKNEVK